jgi:hypothetical protein
MDIQLLKPHHRALLARMYPAAGVSWHALLNHEATLINYGRVHRGVHRVREMPPSCTHIIATDCELPV